jgi:hypothetical protein
MGGCAAELGEIDRDKSSRLRESHSCCEDWVVENFKQSVSAIGEGLLMARSGTAPQSGGPVGLGLDNSNDQDIVPVGEPRSVLGKESAARETATGGSHFSRL